MAKGIQAIENVQRRALWPISGLRHLSCPDRLKNMRLMTLYERRQRGDLIQLFKIRNGIDRLSWPSFEDNNDKQKAIRKVAWWSVFQLFHTTTTTNFFLYSYFLRGAIVLNWIFMLQIFFCWFVFFTFTSLAFIVCIS